ncbi:peptidase M28 [Halobacteriales archaeon QS_1_68_17]|nr:MAG: peptidase M28 [Halobacteriales archaeon QS_1_68_17]
MGWIGDAFTSDTGWNHLETLVDVGDRMAGSDGERRAAEATRDALAAAGARNARIDEFEITGWTRGDSAVRAGGTTHDCIGLPRSPAATATGEFVDLGHGLPEDFADADVSGTVVMVASDVPDWYDRFPHRREKYALAAEGGAVGFVFRNHVEGCLAPTGSVSLGGDPVGPIPAVGVSKEVGTRLARRHEGREATVEVEAEIGPTPSGNVHAELGPDTDERVLVTSHVDAHDIAEGALDNAAGTATVVGIAEALAARASELSTRVEFVAYGAEEVGLVGSAHHASNTDRGNVAAVVNNDGVAGGRTLEVATNGFDELGAAVRRVADRFDHPIAVTPDLNTHSDHWSFVKHGVPGMRVASESDGPGRGWGHTRADTLDKLEAQTLRESTILLTALVADLAGEGVAPDPWSPASIADELDRQGLAEALRAVGDWPY